jgi:hypothetical protein
VSAGARWNANSEREHRVATLSVLRQLWQFMRQRKKLWLLPIIVLLLLASALLILVQGSALAPFIYSVF